MTTFNDEQQILPMDAMYIIQDAIRVEFEVQALLQTLRDCTGPLPAATELRNGIRAKLKSLPAMLKVLERIAREQDRDQDTELVMSKVHRHEEQLERLHEQFRLANVECKENMDRQHLLDRAQLLSLSLRAHSPRVDSAEDAGSVLGKTSVLTNEPTTSHSTLHSKAAAAEAAETSKSAFSSTHNSSELSTRQALLPAVTIAGIRQRSLASSVKSSQQSLLSTSSDITQSLRNTTQLMATQLEQNARTMQVLSSSSKTIDDFHSEFSGHGGLIGTGRRILTNIRRREIADHILVGVGIFIFVCTVLYILRKRLGALFW
ncbi:hypothetical protein CAOG_01002 [Capsaspora owczarzaki ATCC 30864]|uniref:Sec20 C-terminal domain-containing protein n=1 Tax=Capsaspora owczarzaki (strain ATCC 30864) TaxID=595528 RepID=A0A0D2U2Z8_CAPO3|nr:hypothetical protein CAOG_01002 [Capsaspora owczarzaki ATCC 30864]KJE89556.1 hypothetical protein CAOG_001002 [Capsaspora owczarzaki ATCC 30864]|eukprot:XP_004365873.1 hypothetical protein CAOG_01002 [Capsaspora owczarzaki ATCC 30864]